MIGFLHLDPFKSCSDKKSYAVTTLASGIECVLVSNQLADSDRKISSGFPSKLPVLALSFS